MALTAAQTDDMLADLAAGALGDVFSQAELDRLYTRAGQDYNLAVYMGWLQTLGNSAKWINYRVAQTHVNRGDAFAHIEKMVELWGSLAKTGANQVRVVGMRSIPPRHKPVPADQYPKPWPYRRNRWD